MDTPHDLIPSCSGFLSCSKSWISNLLTPSFWTELLHVYKYWIVIGGALLEGEMVLILAGAAAYHNYMSLYWVMAIAFVGALIHDHALFFVGRFFGKKFFLKSEKWNTRLEKITALIHKYDRYFIMSFRFIYGIRTLTPLIVGTTRISLKRYSMLVAISAFIWAVVVAYLGYSCAMALEALIENFDKYKKYLALGIGLLIAVIFLILKYKGYLGVKIEEETPIDTPPSCPQPSVTKETPPQREPQDPKQET